MHDKNILDNIVNSVIFGKRGQKCLAIQRNGYLKINILTWYVYIT